MNSNPFTGLLYSRKFWLAVLGVAQSLILHYMDVPDEIWLSINGLLVTVIFGIAYEDGAAKGNPGSQTNLLTTGTTDVTVNQPPGAGAVPTPPPSDELGLTNAYDDDETLAAAYEKMARAGR